MTHIIVSFDSFVSATAHLSTAQAVKTLRCLKEAAIRDQNFETAIVLRDEEKRLTGGKTGMNARKPQRRRKA